jgi:hypothetical protein
MMSIQTETIPVGSTETQFSERVVRGSFRMLVPVDFAEDKSLVSNYTYLYSPEQSPLSMAIKYTTAASLEDRERQIAVYFGKAADVQADREYDSPVLYRETVTDSQYLSIYSLRFAVEEADGLLLGCFNCATAAKDDWRPIVLKMLGTIKVVEA